MAPRGHLILGAGCAGLGLAVALLDEGVHEEIVLVDARRSFGRDRTWCLWDVGSTPLTRRASHRWTSWAVRGPRGDVAVQTSQRHPYVHLDARDVYAAALERLDRAPNVTLRLGERVLDHGEDEDRAWARTARGLLEGAWVHDALGAGSPALATPGAAAGLWQTFLGQEVEVDRPVFDPGCATLMDFGVEQRGGLRFTYVLPFSRTRALVEDTSVAPEDLPAEVRRAAVAEHLAERYGVGAFAVLHEERGRLPMGAGHGAGLPPLGRRSTRVGLAGGAVRPSSGYAFARIQRQVGLVAHALAQGRRPPTSRVGGARAAALDGLFLRGLAAQPQDFPDHFLALARRVPGDVFARFLSDASSPLDEARVIAALGSPAFVGAALRGQASG